MQYRNFGNTGFRISALGFGAMRLPISTPGPSASPDLDAAVKLLRRGFTAGINYVDTAYFYCDGQSEIAVGRALKDGWRDKVVLSTKLPLNQVKCIDDFRRILEDQLRKLDTDHIDFYHLHGIGEAALTGPIREFKIFESAARARDEGLIHHLSFSFHDRPEAMKTLVDTGEFSSVLCQYNLLDTANAEAAAYAASKGLGTVAMGPVGGGRLAFAGSIFEDAVGGRLTTPELALRYVLSNRNFNCALSGMGTPEMVDANARIADADTPLTPGEVAAIEEIREKCAALRKLYCTGCAYCRPECPKNVDIPAVLLALILYKVYHLEQHARDRYRQLATAAGNDPKTARAADGCVKCGKCEQVCPQKLPIRQFLAEAEELFAES